MSILELIDNALDGDGDAMRWTPKPAPSPTTADGRREMVTEVRVFMFWLKAWWVAHSRYARRRAFGAVRWSCRSGHWQVVRAVCSGPDCRCCGAVRAREGVTPIDQP